ncbi:3-oxo-Delta(4,5)-steroid 5-beta-reductase [Capsicum chinense]|nr:3-oxo-Delta(4,5)-steroid 5-beta-reductase [Capsicum chinense]
MLAVGLSINGQHGILDDLVALWNLVAGNEWEDYSRYMNLDGVDMTVIKIVLCSILLQRILSEEISQRVLLMTLGGYNKLLKWLLLLMVQLDLDNYNKILGHDSPFHEDLPRLHAPNFYNVQDNLFKVMEKKEGLTCQQQGRVVDLEGALCSLV